MSRLPVVCARSLAALALACLPAGCDPRHDPKVDAQSVSDARDATDVGSPELQPDSVSEPDAPVVEPDAPVVEPDAPVVEPDAPVVEPDGFPDTEADVESDAVMCVPTFGSCTDDSECCGLDFCRMPRSSRICCRPGNPLGGCCSEAVERCGGFGPDCCAGLFCRTVTNTNTARCSDSPCGRLNESCVLGRPGGECCDGLTCAIGVGGTESNNACKVKAGGACSSNSDCGPRAGICSPENGLCCVPLGGSGCDSLGGGPCCPGSHCVGLNTQCVAGCAAAEEACVRDSDCCPGNRCAGGLRCVPR
jgi:hypothetical protein